MRIILILLCAYAASMAAAETHVYTVSIDNELSLASVEARFLPDISRVTARQRGAEDFLLEAFDCESHKRLEPVSRSLEASGDITCLSYVVDLHKASSTGGWFPKERSDALLLPIDAWMWRPGLGRGDEIIVTFDLPDGIAVSVPWEPVAGSTSSFRLTASPRSGRGLSLFGRFEQRLLSITGADLRIAIVPVSGQDVTTDVFDWTRSTAEHVTLAYGRFPNPNPRVLLYPASSRRGESAIQFGRVVRDGGETVELLFDPGQPEEIFVSDWTATHEFAHLLLPYVRRDERWISEGFAGYYQNVLLARAGRYSEAQAWQKLAEGLERGRRSVPTLSPNEAASQGEHGSRMKIYWSGAALFLMADVELRQRSGGSITLDTVLDRFQACCLPSDRAWSGQELVETLDSLGGNGLFMSLYRQHADAAGFPPFRTLLDKLGVRVDNGRSVLVENAELAAIRSAITERR